MHNQQVAFVDDDNDGYNHAISNEDIKNGNAITSSMMALLCGCMDVWMDWDLNGLTKEGGWTGAIIWPVLDLKEEIVQNGSKNTKTAINRQRDLARKK